MIVVRNLTKRYADVVAVRDASFEVEAGEVMGFLGPNGAGKTTTLRILTGYLPATAGTVQVDGLDVLTQSLAVRERIGYLPEQVPLYLDMRVEEYLKFRGRLKGVSVKELGKHVGDAMSQCGLEHMRRKIIGQLSKGYRQRVGLADALVSRPRLLILDEPTGGLDPHQRREVLELIRTLADDQTILLSSHVLSEVETISHRVMIIQHGRLLAVGKPHELARQLQEAARVRMEVRCTADQARTLVAPLGRELDDLKVSELEDGWVVIEARATGDPRAALGERARGEGVPLRELKRDEFSLEELFLRITAKAAIERTVVTAADTPAEEAETPA